MEGVPGRRGQSRRESKASEHGVGELEQEWWEMRSEGSGWVMQGL